MLEELVADILTDFTDEDGSALVSEEYVERAAERSFPLIVADLDEEFELDDSGEVTPEMSGPRREIWLTKTKIMVCRFLRARSSSRVNFSSGDKKMDRSKDAANWAALEKDLASEYANRVRRINPAADESVLTTTIYPVRYSRGSQLEE